jgi:hypothetical protein
VHLQWQSLVSKPLAQVALLALAPWAAQQPQASNKETPIALNSSQINLFL